MCQATRADTTSRKHKLTVDPRQVRKHVLQYARSDDSKAWQTVALSVILYAASLLMYPVLDWRVWAIFRGLVIIRIFIVFHDCCHGSLFSSREMNYWVGKVFGAIGMAPMERWRTLHVHHHQIFGTIDTLDLALTVHWTKEDYEACPAWKKALFRVFRDPFLFFFVGPIAIFMIWYRFSGGGGATFTNLFKATELLLLYWVMGPAFLTSELMGLMFSGAFGFVLFHLQHHFNPAYCRQEASSRSPDEAALIGSSWLYVPWFLRWATLGIEFHHIHHFSTRVPCYRIKECHDNAPPGSWNDVTFLGPLVALRSLWHVYFNTQTERYESFPLYERLLTHLFPGCEVAM